MKRCTYPDCGGALYVEPADDANVGPAGIKRTQLICNFCGRVTTGSPPAKPLPLVHASRFQPTTTIHRTGT